MEKNAEYKYGFNLGYSDWMNGYNVHRKFDAPEPSRDFDKGYRDGFKQSQRDWGNHA